MDAPLDDNLDRGISVLASIGALNARMMATLEFAKRHGLTYKAAKPIKALLDEHPDDTLLMDLFECAVDVIQEGHKPGMTATEYGCHLGFLLGWVIRDHYRGLGPSAHANRKEHP